jgi:hypothetical protein
VHHSRLALTLMFASAVASTQDLLSSCTAIDEDMVSDCVVTTPH